MDGPLGETALLTLDCISNMFVMLGRVAVSTEYAS